MSDLPNFLSVHISEPNTYRIIRADYYTRRVEDDLFEAEERNIVTDEVAATVDFHLSKIRSDLLTQGYYGLVYGISGAKYINDAFKYSNEYGNRFNDNNRGAWYCAFSLSTACNEVGYHISVELENLGIHSLPRKYQKLLRNTPVIKFSSRFSLN